MNTTEGMGGKRSNLIMCQTRLVKPIKTSPSRSSHCWGSSELRTALPCRIPLFSRPNNKETRGHVATLPFGSCGFDQDTVTSRDKGDGVSRLRANESVQPNEPID